jgi:hypothetical protein
MQFLEFDSKLNSFYTHPTKSGRKVIVRTPGDYEIKTQPLSVKG